MSASGQIPGEITLSSVLLACANLCSLEVGKMVHAKIVKLGIEHNIFMGTALSDMYAKSGDLDSSKRIFYQMPEKNSITWTAMVQGLAENGFAKDSILLFENMMAYGISPNEHTFLAILFACSTVVWWNKPNIILKQCKPMASHLNRSTTPACLMS